MPPDKENSGPTDPHRRAITNRIARIGLVCSGTLLERSKTCGKPNCRCATDPRARHGPYHEWTWREGGKLRHKIVPPERVDALREAIQDCGTVQDLLTRWERQSAAIIFGRPDRGSQSSKQID